jgi:tRNA1Val (adenine37-N6)-methyltransferase
MPNTYFRFRQFTVQQDRAAMKVCTDACLFGAWVADFIRDIHAQSILDIGAGTGLLSLMLAQQSGARIDAVEVDQEAYEQTGENFLASPWSDRLQVHHESVQNFKPSYKYDLIISNPPFYENDLRSPDKQRNTAMHGSQLSFSELLEDTKRLLKEDGNAAFLIPAERHETFELLLQQDDFMIIKKAFVQQTENHRPFRAMYMVNFSGNDKSIESAITIKENGIYTDEFNRLLKSYYLYI